MTRRAIRAQRTGNTANPLTTTKRFRRLFATHVASSGDGPQRLTRSWKLWHTHWEVRRGSWIALLFAMTEPIGCGRPCPSGRFCGVATWVSGEHEPIVEGSSVMLFAMSSSDPERGPFVSPEELALRPRAVGVWFDLSAARARGTKVERATLLLSPHPRWRTIERSVHIAVHAGSAANANDAIEPMGDLVSTATIPLAMRAPVRLDVTPLVRAWWDGALPSGLLAISADQEGMVVQSASTVDERLRPRLEVVVR